MKAGASPWLLLALIAGTSTTSGSTEIHVSKFGEAPDFIDFQFSDTSTTLRVEAANGFVMKAHALPESPEAKLYGATTETEPKPVNLGKISLPKSGRHILLISRTDSGESLLKVLPFDRTAHPPGGVRFLNLSSVKIRCSLEADSLELAPGEDKLHQKIDPARRIVNQRLQSWENNGWKTENATTLILGANRRFLFVFSQARPNGEIRRKLLTDFDPEGNLAQLEPTPVKAEPPLPDPPAK